MYVGGLEILVAIERGLRPIQIKDKIADPPRHSIIYNEHMYTIQDKRELIGD